MTTAAFPLDERDALRVLDAAAGLVPLREREPPARVVPLLPFSCYRVMLDG